MLYIHESLLVVLALFVCTKRGIWLRLNPFFQCVSFQLSFQCWIMNNILPDLSPNFTFSPSKWCWNWFEMCTLCEPQRKEKQTSKVDNNRGELWWKTENQLSAATFYVIFVRLSFCINIIIREHALNKWSKKLCLFMLKGSKFWWKIKQIRLVRRTLKHTMVHNLMVGRANSPFALRKYAAQYYDWIHWTKAANLLRFIIKFRRLQTDYMR